jgi:hypothetical protein
LLRKALATLTGRLRPLPGTRRAAGILGGLPGGADFEYTPVTAGVVVEVRADSSREWSLPASPVGDSCESSGLAEGADRNPTRSGRGQMRWWGGLRDHGRAALLRTQTCRRETARQVQWLPRV